MATVPFGDQDPSVSALKAALEEYEREHPGSVASLYRRNPASIRVRVVDRQFGPTIKSKRHAALWDFLTARVGDDVMADVSLLLTLTPAEAAQSVANGEFERPSPSIVFPSAP